MTCPGNCRLLRLLKEQETFKNNYRLVTFSHGFPSVSQMLILHLTFGFLLLFKTLLPVNKWIHSIPTFKKELTVNKKSSTKISTLTLSSMFGQKSPANVPHWALKK